MFCENVQLLTSCKSSNQNGGHDVHAMLLRALKRIFLSFPFAHIDREEQHLGHTV